MVTTTKTSEGGKTARACDSCISKRARWYCAADDAFLCQACDASVHSANSLARRHDRVRLQTASLKPSSPLPSWHHGFTKKARTPRPGKAVPMPVRNPFFDVPEVSTKEETSRDEAEEFEHFLHRVPVLGMEPNVGSSDFDGYLSYVMDPAEFAADVESLLGNTLDNECFDLEELGLMDSKEEINKGVVKIENDEILATQLHDGDDEEIVDVMREPFELNIEDFGSSNYPASCGKEEEKPVMVGVMAVMKKGEFEMEEMENEKKKVSLSLDSDAVIIAWGSRGTPWTSGDRPNFDLDNHWLECMARSGEYYHPFGETGGGGMRRQHGGGAIGEGEREARVLRYREKRRTRLFAKKIRYEVRKLNAEKRPRMKGRFVKRSSCFAPPPLQLFN